MKLYHIKWINPYNNVWGFYEVEDRRKTDGFYNPTSRTFEVKTLWYAKKVAEQYHWDLCEEYTVVIECYDTVAKTTTVVKRYEAREE